MRTCSSRGASCSRRSATIATTSKYAHHSAAAVATPSSAPTTTRAPRFRPPAPRPSETIDPPGARLNVRAPPPETEGADRLPQRDDDDQAVALCEVARLHPPALDALRR